MGNRLNKVKKWFSKLGNQLLVTIIASGIIASITSEYVRAKIIGLLQYISQPIILPAFLPFLLVLIGMGIVYVIYKSKKHTKESYKDYNKDTFDGIKWTWKYVDGSKDVNLNSLTAICPECNSTLQISDNDIKVRVMVEDQVKTILRCLSRECELSKKNDQVVMERSGYKWELKTEISRRIEQNLRNKGLKD